MTHMLLTLLQSGYYADSGSQGIHYSAAMIGMYILIIVIGIAGYAVQARLQSVFRKYSKVQFPGGLTGAEVAEKMLRDNHIHNVKVTHVSGHLTDHFNPQTMTVNLSDSDIRAGHAARGVQRLGPRAGVAAGQPHDAGSAARSGERGAGLGRTHLSRSGTERRRVGSLLGLRNPRTARLIPG